MNTLIIIVAQWFIVLPVLLSLILLWRLDTRRARIRYVLIVAASGLFALAIASILKTFIDDPRPFVVGHVTPLLSHAADNGFPSDHTLFAAVLAFVALLYSKRYGIMMFVLAILIGVARVAAGVHHVEDIVGSFIISAVGVAIVVALAKLITHEARVAHQK